MQEIRPAIQDMDVFCAETPAPSCGLVVFGASGDLTRRKVVPSLRRLWQRGLLDPAFYVVGCGRKPFTDDAFRDHLRSRTGTERVPYPGGAETRPDADPKAAAPEPSAAADTTPPSFRLGTGEQDQFLRRFYYVPGRYDDPAFYATLARRIAELDTAHGVTATHLFYLAVPPELYETIVDGLAAAGLNHPAGPCCDQPPRLIVEKPFGRDLPTAEALNEGIGRHFAEPQIYRIDHYLGKETIQNLLVFRFANAIFEPVWNRNYVDHVQITIAESVGVEHRAGYYDTNGALRDMFQNHMLQMLALAAMEPPASFDAEAVRDEKAKLIRSIRPIHPGTPDGRPADILRARYTAGRIAGRPVPAYLDEPGVAPDSRTETFVAARLFIDNWRWKDVPFYLRTGKRLARKLTEIAITFKQVPHSMFASVGLADLPPNQLILKIQPDEGIALSFQAKRPGAKTCITTLTMDFSYRDLFGAEPPEAYERLLLDAMAGDHTLFSRQDAVHLSWALLADVLAAWADPRWPLYEYPAGSESFPEADHLITADARRWRGITKSCGWTGKKSGVSLGRL